MTDNINVKPTIPIVNRANKEKLIGQRGFLIWFTGLPATGKTTLSSALELLLYEKGYITKVLDGDNLRYSLNKDLDFSRNGRKLNILRAACVAKMFVENGIITISAFISPFQEDRQAVRELVGNNDFIEVYLHCPLDVLKSRDPKGHYKKAEQKLIENYTGITSPYEEPLSPCITINTSELSIDTCVSTIYDYLVAGNYIK